ncbi:helix-turn-helix domain-containing protein [Pseudohaliea sp.]|uniref:helix-turn-helix domain-containing protein n=1 Tax=Pseudohaliea sp. TaxID=2740289 RepID=UPI0032F00EBF
MSLGENLRRLRIDRGMTQGELSNKSGVGLGQISKLERNKADPTLSTLYKLMTALDCSADRLLMDKEKSGLSAVLKEQFERVSGLPEGDQETLIRIMDKFCIANGLRAMLDEHRVLIGISGSSGVADVLD